MDLKNNKNELVKNYAENPEFLSKFDTLNDIDKVKSYTELKGKFGIYSFINLIDGKQYIGSYSNLYVRLLQHIKGGALLPPPPEKTNIRLKNAMKKHGRKNFIFVIYAYSPNVLPMILELENKFSNNFSKDRLYNILQFVTSSLGFKHSEETRDKMSCLRSWLEMN